MKLRLMMIASIALDLQDRDRKALVQSLDMEDRDMLHKLYWLGVDPAKYASKKGKLNKDIDEISKAARNKLKNISTNLCRYTPTMENITGLATGDRIDNDAYGSLFIPTSYDGSLGSRSKGSAGNALSKKGGKLAKTEISDDRAQPKIIFFIIGGISFTEIRVIDEFAKNNPQFNVMAGSTSIIKAADYLAGISKMLSKAEYDELKSKD